MFCVIGEYSYECVSYCVSSVVIFQLFFFLISFALEEDFVFL